MMEIPFIVCIWFWRRACAAMLTPLGGTMACSFWNSSASVVTKTHSFILRLLLLLLLLLLKTLVHLQRMIKNRSNKIEDRRTRSPSVQGGLYKHALILTATSHSTTGRSPVTVVQSPITYRVHTSFGRRAFSFVGPSIWNSLPTDLTSCETVSTFKRRLRRTIFDQSFVPNCNSGSEAARLSRAAYVTIKNFYYYYDIQMIPGGFSKSRTGYPMV